MKRCPHVRAAGIIRDGRVLCSACEWQRMERADHRWREACRALWSWPR